jgi:hypothetical protein
MEKRAKIIQVGVNDRNSQQRQQQGEVCPQRSTRRSSGAPRAGTGGNEQWQEPATKAIVVIRIAAAVAIGVQNGIEAVFAAGAEHVGVIDLQD